MRIVIGLLACLMLVLPIVMGVDLTPGLVSCWTFDDTINDSVGGYHGEKNAGCAYVTGKVGTKALSFRGGVNNDYFRVPDSANDPYDNIDAISINFWVNITDTDTFYRLVHLHGAWSATVQGANTDDEPRWFVATSGSKELHGAYQSYLPYYGEWTMLTYTWTRYNHSIYKNGALWFSQNMNDGGATIADVSQYLYIGLDEDGSTLDLTGTLDEPAIWNVTLTAEQVAALYASGSGMSCSAIAGSGSTCTYSGSGDWVINLADACNTTTNVTVQAGYDINLTGVGTWYVDATVTFDTLNNLTTSGQYVKMNTSNAYLKVRG